MTDDIKAAFKAARATFPPEKMDWVCVAKSVGADKKAMWGAYIKVDYIRERLDDAFGPWGWAFDVHLHETQIVGEKGARAKITAVGTLRIGDVHRSDVGTDEFGFDDNAAKSAVSRALVRCASAFGIGDEVRGVPFAYTHDFRTKPTQLPGEGMRQAPQKAAEAVKTSEADLARLSDAKAALVVVLGTEQAVNAIIGRWCTDNDTHPRRLSPDHADALLDYMRELTERPTEDIADRVTNDQLEELRAWAHKSGLSRAEWCVKFSLHPKALDGGVTRPTTAQFNRLLDAHDDLKF